VNTIQSISLSQFNTGEFIDTSSQLVSIVEPLVVSDQFIARQVSQIKESVETLVTIERTPRGSDLTDLIAGDDSEQDILVALIWDHLETGAKSGAFFPEKAEACSTILKFYENRNREVLLRGSLRTQGVEMRALLADLLDLDQVDNLITAGIDQMVAKLNELFESLQAHREARNNEGNLPSTKTDEKKILRYRLDKMLSYIDCNILDEVAGFESVRTPVNEVISKVMAQYRARTTRKESSNN